MIDIGTIEVNTLDWYDFPDLVQIFLSIPEKKTVSTLDLKFNERIAWRKSGNRLVAKRYEGKELKEKMEWKIGYGKWFLVLIPDSRWDNNAILTLKLDRWEYGHRAFCVNANWVDPTIGHTSYCRKMCSRLKLEGIPREFYGQIIEFALNLLKNDGPA
jgi:hypothetical protein